MHTWNSWPTLVFISCFFHCMHLYVILCVYLCLFLNNALTCLYNVSIHLAWKSAKTFKQSKGMWLMGWIDSGDKRELWPTVPLYEQCLASSKPKKYDYFLCLLFSAEKKKFGFSVSSGEKSRTWKWTLSNKFYGDVLLILC